jgi:S1-C subfamily serine protease
VSEDGDLLTNFHVIQERLISALAPTRAPFLVFERVIAESADSDVAVLKFQATDLDYLKVWDYIGFP